MATRALSADAPRASCGNAHDYSPSRRSVVTGGALAVALAAVSAPAVASGPITWSASNWLTRWNAIGCGARLDGNGHVRLTGLFSDAGALLGELTPARYEAVAGRLRMLRDFEGADPAVQAAEEWRAIEQGWTGEDDEDAEQRWTASYNRATQRLIDAPARTPRGLAAKLRVGVLDRSEGPYGKLVDQVIAQLECMA